MSIANMVHVDEHSRSSSQSAQYNYYDCVSGNKPILAEERRVHK